MFKKIIALALVAVMCVTACVAFASCGEGEEATGTQVLEEVALKDKFEVPSDFKIGFILLHDENSTYDLNFINAAKKIKKHLGLSDSQVLFEKGIPEEGSSSKEAANRLISRGCKVIFADSFGHEANMIEIARENPTVQVCHATGTRALTENLSNYHNAFASIYEGRYLAGVAAGLKLNEMIAKGKITAEKAVIGYVGAFPYAEVVSGYTSFFLGARSVCPTATMKVRYTSSWYDYTKEQEAAKSLINVDKCVLISQHADSMGAPNACELAGVPNVSYNGSTLADCPETFIISSAINWAPYYYEIIKAAVDGTDIPANWTGTIATGSVVLSVLNEDAAAEGTLEVLQTIAAGLQAGTIKVFDTSKFTVGGSAVTTYLADVRDMGDYVGETEVIRTEGGITFFAESADRSAPYFDLRIDGITEINN